MSLFYQIYYGRLLLHFCCVIGGKRRLFADRAQCRGKNRWRARNCRLALPWQLLYCPGVSTLRSLNADCLLVLLIRFHFVCFFVLGFATVVDWEETRLPWAGLAWEWEKFACQFWRGTPDRPSVARHHSLIARLLQLMHYRAQVRDRSCRVPCSSAIQICSAHQRHTYKLSSDTHPNSPSDTTATFPLHFAFWRSTQRPSLASKSGSVSAECIARAKGHFAICRTFSHWGSSCRPHPLSHSPAENSPNLSKPPFSAEWLSGLHTRSNRLSLPFANQLKLFLFFNRNN